MSLAEHDHVMKKLDKDYIGTIYPNATHSPISQKGGEIMVRGTGELKIPAKAVHDETVFWMWRDKANAQRGNRDVCLSTQGTPPADIPNGGVMYSLPVNIGPVDIEFRKEVILTLTVKNFRKPDDGDSTPLDVYMKQTENDQWKPVGSCWCDNKNGTATFTLKRFSSYVLGLPGDSPRLRALNVFVLIPRNIDTMETNTQSRKKLKVFFIINDLSYIEEFIIDQRLDVHRATCLYLHPASDVTVAWVKKACAADSDKVLEIIEAANSDKKMDSEKETLHQQYLRSLAERAVFLEVDKPSLAKYPTEKDTYQDLLVLMQDGNVVLELRFEEGAVLPSDTDSMMPKLSSYQELFSCRTKLMAGAWKECCFRG